MTKAAEPIEDFKSPFSGPGSPGDPVSYRVYWEDTDAGGIVYNANYMRLFERGRTEWLRRCGINQELLRQKGMIVVVKNMNIDFTAPAKLDDVLEVYTVVESMKRVGATMLQEVHVNGELIVNARVQLAFLDAATLRPAKLPDEVMDKISRHLD